MRLFHRIGRQALTQGLLKAHPNRCVRTHSTMSRCSSCRDVCAEKALTFAGDHWQIADHCTQCGFCVSACPLDVFYFDVTLPIPDGKSSLLVLSCSQDKAGEDLGNKMPCFQSLSPEDIALLLDSLGSLVLFASCEDCPNNWYPEGLTGRLNQLHIPWEGRLHVIRNRGDLEPFLPPAMDRRDFFIKSAHELRRSGGLQLATLLDDIILELPIPDKDATEAPTPRDLRLEKMARYYSNHPEISGDLDLPYPRLSNQGCHFCGACVRLCPTEALSIEDNEDGRTLFINPRRCVHCNLCKDICMNVGFQWHGRLQVNDLRKGDLQVLAEGSERDCVMCGTPHYFMGTEDICFFCAQQKA